jgi:hypothetical protein
VDSSTVVAWTGVVLALFNAALVGVTLYYARQTRRMADEMHEARRVSVLPKLAIDFRHRGAGFAEIVVRNVGQGPALDADLELAFEPLPGTDQQRISRPWRASVIAPGEDHRFYPPVDAAGQLMHMDALVAAFARITLRGTCHPSLGDPVTIDDEMADLSESWQLAQDADHALQEDPAEKSAAALKRSAKAQEDQARAVKSLSKAFPVRYHRPLDRRVQWGWKRLNRGVGELARLLPGRQQRG